MEDQSVGNSSSSSSSSSSGTYRYSGEAIPPSESSSTNTTPSSAPILSAASNFPTQFSPALSTQTAPPSGRRGARRPTVATIVPTSQGLAVDTTQGMLPGYNPLRANYVREPREKNPAFKDPDVRRAFARLNARLAEASKKTGDITKDVHDYIVIPLFSTTNLGSVPQIRNLWEGGTQINRRDGTVKQYASPQYGWFQNYLTHFIVCDLIRRNLGVIATPQSIQRRQPINDLKSFRHKFSREVKIWWATNSTRLLPIYAEHVKNSGLGYIAGTPILVSAFTAAIQAKAAHQNVKQHLGEARYNQLMSAPYSISAPLINQTPTGLNPPLH